MSYIKGNFWTVLVLKGEFEVLESYRKEAKVNILGMLASGFGQYARF
jgi:hypothetical protein